MTTTNLQHVAQLVTRRAQRQGYVMPEEVRQECVAAGFPEDRWEEVIAHAGATLQQRGDRYYYSSPVTERVRAEQAQQSDIQQAIQELVQEHREAAQRAERRGQGRIEFIQPVKVILEDGRQLTLLTRDLSSTGLRLIGTRRLLGQKVLVRIPSSVHQSVWEFHVRILWTCPVGDDLVENGGSFLSVTPPAPRTNDPNTPED